MATTKLYIPDRINVGFQNRGDTYTQKLAYVIYYDHKGKLRKEASWQGWRDQKIPNVEYMNEPTDGFVLNKGVGGARQSYGWNTRNEYIRVYDPRDFEFEISVSNLLFILRESVCNKGKGLEGKFVYAWDGTELVLLPEDSTDYQESRNHTTLQTSKVSAKELILGATYLAKDQQKLTYLGRFEYNEVLDKNAVQKISKRHVFWNGKAFDIKSGLTSIAKLESDHVTDQYAQLVSRYNLKTANGSRPVRLFLDENRSGASGRYWYREVDGMFEECERYYGSSSTVLRRYFLKDNIIVGESMRKAKIASRYSYYDHDHCPKTSEKPTSLRLYAELENGQTVQVQDNDFKVVHTIKNLHGDDQTFVVEP